MNKIKKPTRVGFFVCFFGNIKCINYSQWQEALHIISAELILIAQLTLFNFVATLFTSALMLDIYIIMRYN